MPTPLPWACSFLSFCTNKRPLDGLTAPISHISLG